MGNSSQKQNQQQPQQSQLSRELRLALRVPDGPQAAVDSEHRSARVLEILANPEFDSSKDIQVEHLLEIVDNNWEEKGVEKVLTKIISEMVQDEKMLRSLILQCMLYQRCWHACDLGLEKYISILKKNQNQQQKISAEDATVFNFAILETPLKLVLKTITELKWVANKETNPIHTHQFRLLATRLAREHRPPKSEEQKKKEEIKEKLQTEHLKHLCKKDEEISKTVLIEFLKVSGASDFLTEADIKKAIDLQTSEKVKSAFEVLLKPWSQLEATVGETPLSWTCASCQTKQYVTQTALALQKKGLTFPAGARVLSFLVCPCSNDIPVAENSEGKKSK